MTYSMIQALSAK